MPTREDEAASPRGWSSERNEVVYHELRGVLDAQKTVMADIDDKAMRTVRVTVVLLGIVVSGASLEAVTFQPVLASLGVAVLVISAAAGVFTYGESDLVLGPSADYAVGLVADEPGLGWELDYVVELAGWTAQNATDIAYNGRLLFYTQALFVAGVAFLAASVAFYPALAYLGT